MAESEKWTRETFFVLTDKTPVNIKCYTAELGDIVSVMSDDRKAWIFRPVLGRGTFPNIDGKFVTEVCKSLLPPYQEVKGCVHGQAGIEARSGLDPCYEPHCPWSRRG